MKKRKAVEEEAEEEEVYDDDMDHFHDSVFEEEDELQPHPEDEEDPFP